METPNKEMDFDHCVRQVRLLAAQNNRSLADIIQDVVAEIDDKEVAIELAHDLWEYFTDKEEA